MSCVLYLVSCLLCYAFVFELYYLSQQQVLALVSVMVRVLRLTRQQVQERAARGIKARTEARLTKLIKEAAAEQRLEYRRDQDSFSST